MKFTEHEAAAASTMRAHLSPEVKRKAEEFAQHLDHLLREDTRRVDRMQNDDRRLLQCD